MAAAVINSQRFDVAGNRRRQTYNITAGTGDTLTTGLNSIITVNVAPTATNPPTVTHSGGTVTFTASGSFTTDVEVVGN